VTLGVTDLSRTLEFYEHGFVFPVKRRDGQCVTLGLGGERSELELCPWDALAADAGTSPESSGFRGFTLNYIVEQAADVDDVLARLERFGGAVTKAPRFAFWGYSAHVTDPSGHLWKIASPKRKALIARKRVMNGVPEPVPAQELALTIGVADMKRSKAFYGDGFGNEPKKDYSKFVSFDGAGTPDLAMYPWDALADDAGVPAAGHGFRGFSISHVADSGAGVNELRVRAEKAGATVLGSAYFSDPDGYLWKIAARA
jgi:catechol 2,3-dioxygenase-like lactoylglutathione lyase family enzyme